MNRRFCTFEVMRDGRGGTESVLQSIRSTPPGGMLIAPIAHIDRSGVVPVDEWLGLACARNTSLSQELSLHSYGDRFLFRIPSNVAVDRIPDGLSPDDHSTSQNSDEGDQGSEGSETSDEEDQSSEISEGEIIIVESFECESPASYYEEVRTYFRYVLGSVNNPCVSCWQWFARTKWNV